MFPILIPNTQVAGPIDAGSSGEASMNVTLTQGAEGSCDTTVTVTLQNKQPPDQPAQPASKDATVTTTAGDGEDQPSSV